MSAPHAADKTAESGFSEQQGQYLAFILTNTKIHRRQPAEGDMQRYFQVTLPTVHQMVISLERKRLIQRTPSKERGIIVGVDPDKLPRLI